MKDHCRIRIIVPGWLTLYLKADDIGIYREFKDGESVFINLWKNSEGLEYTVIPGLVKHEMNWKLRIFPIQLNQQVFR